MKLLFIVSSLDLTQPFSATPAWWQLLKGLYDEGVEVLATTYQGPAIESLWWRALPNPVKREGDLFLALRKAARLGRTGQTQTGRPGESASDRLQRQVARRIILPKWKAFIDKTLAAHPDLDAIIFLTIPLNQVVGLAGYIRQRWHKPVLFYDGDVPASLPVFAGFGSGFKIYYGADPTEYDGFISNSAGGADALREMGAKAVHVLYYGADPDVYAPLALPQDIDVFFYGHGREYRERWIDAMLGDASRALPDVRFAARGHSLGDLGSTAMLPYLSFSKLREYVCRSRINLCVTRHAHASVFASASARPFELASLGACIVCNPYHGIETWFEPGKELIVVNSAEEVLERYGWLLSHESERRALGEAARARLLKEHTMRHRARELTQIVRQYL
jgi:glycosyltransferase involved in cell wall biosynthesis